MTRRKEALTDTAVIRIVRLRITVICRSGIGGRRIAMSIFRRMLRPLISPGVAVQMFATTAGMQARVGGSVARRGATRSCRTDTTDVQPAGAVAQQQRDDAQRGTERASGVQGPDQRSC